MKTQQPDMPPANPRENPAMGHGIIQMHLRDMRQLFDSLDHSPFREKDLDRNAEEYIVESMKELPARTPCELVIYVDQPAGAPDESDVIEEAIHVHFARRADVLRRALPRLLRRGSISLAIGLSFLATFFLIGQFIRQMMGEGHGATLLREGLLIGGWVAMWKPLEIFLYDWWPIVGERRMHERLSQMKVRIVHTAPRPASGRIASPDEASPASFQN